MITATLGSEIRRVQVTIPIDSDVGTTVGALLRSAGFGGAPVAFKILPTLADGTTSRAAFRIASRRPGATGFAGTDYTTHGQHVAAGVECQSEPGDRDFDSAIRAAAGAAFPAVIVAVY
jgi:hypothetical protein